MNPREASLLNAAAILLARHGQDAAYGPAHAVRDALALEEEVSLQLGARTGIFAQRGATHELEAQREELRKLGAL